MDGSGKGVVFLCGLVLNAQAGSTDYMELGLWDLDGEGACCCDEGGILFYVA